MARRDAFSTLRPEQPDETPGETPAVDGAAQEPVVASQPLDLIPSAQPRKPRNREWERKRRAETVTYRGVPPAYHEFLGRLAASLNVPRDEVVRAFLEYSIALYRAGKLALHAYPRAQHMTLFPEHRSSKPAFLAPDKTQAAWLEQAFPAAGKKRKDRKPGKQKQEEPVRWQQRVTYRIPVELKAAIRELAEEHTLPVGELVWYFIEQALKAYQSGDLLLQPEPRITGRTLFVEE